MSGASTRLGLEFGPYPPEAYQFVREGLEHTSRALHGDVSASQPVVEKLSRHVDGRQLCLGLRDYAIEQFGMMALTVLRRWHIHRTDDFGRIVFNMVEAGLLSKTEEDRPSDFAGVYDFDEVFGLVEVG